MSLAAVGLFVIACGWNVYRLFTPTRAAALRAEGHPQYFGAFLAGGYVAFLAIFLHTAATKLPYYSEAIAELARLAPAAKADTNVRERSDGGDAARQDIVRTETITTGRAGVVRETSVAPMPRPLEAKSKTPNDRADPYPIILGVGLWSALLAIVLPFFLNLPFRLNKRANLLAGLKSANEVERALVDALAGGTSVMITLVTGKVYVGIPSEFDPNGDEPDWVRIWPLASGYRTPEGRLVLSTAYGLAYSKIDKSGAKIGLSQDHFRILLPVERTASIQAFSLAFYIQHFATTGGDGQPGLSEALKDATAARRREVLAMSSAPFPPPLKNDYPYGKVVPDSFLRVLKWVFHIAITIAIVALPFSTQAAGVSAAIAGFMLFLLWDPTDEHVKMLMAAVADPMGISLPDSPRITFDFGQLMSNLRESLRRLKP